MAHLRPLAYAARPIAALGVLVAGTVLAACGTSAAPPTSSPSSTSTTRPSSSSTSTTSPASTTTAGPSSSTCSTGILQLAVAAGGAAAGTSYSRFTVTNDGPSTCALEGYPTLSFYGPSGASGAGAGPKLALSALHAGPAPSPVTLAPKGTAEFLVVLSDVPVGGVGCSTVASVDVALPGSGEALSVPVTLAPCGPTVNVYAFGAPGSESP